MRVEIEIKLKDRHLKNFRNIHHLKQDGNSIH